MNLLSNQVRPGLLLGNSFPFSLIRRPVRVFPFGLDSFAAVLARHRVLSFWGHTNTLALAGELLGCDLTPPLERPALRLSANALPYYLGEEFTRCWILSPDYKEDFRPQIGQEIGADMILGWQLLCLEWQ